VVMVGNVDPDRALETALGALTPEFLSRGSGAAMLPADEPAAVAQGQVVERFPTTIPTFYAGFKDDRPRDASESLRQYASASVVMDILFGKSSVLYQQLMGLGLVNGALGMEYAQEEDYAHGVIGAESTDPEAAWTHISGFLDADAASLVTAEDVERIKRKTIGRFLQACNSVESLARMTVTMVNRGMDLFDYYDALQALDVKQVQERLQVMTAPERRSLSVILPKE